MWFVIVLWHLILAGALFMAGLTISILRRRRRRQRLGLPVQFTPFDADGRRYDDIWLDDSGGDLVLGYRSQGVCRYERTVDGTHAGFYPPTPWVNRCGTRTCRRPPNGVCPRCGSPVRTWRWRCTHGGWARMRCACWTRTPITSMGCGGIRTSRCARPRWTRSAASPSHSDLCAVWDA